MLAPAGNGNSPTPKPLFIYREVWWYESTRDLTLGSRSRDSGYPSTRKYSCLTCHLQSEGLSPTAHWQRSLLIRTGLDWSAPGMEHGPLPWDLVGHQCGFHLIPFTQIVPGKSSGVVWKYCGTALEPAAVEVACFLSR